MFEVGLNINRKHKIFVLEKNELLNYSTTLGKSCTKNLVLLTQEPSYLGLFDGIMCTCV